MRRGSQISCGLRQYINYVLKYPSLLLTKQKGEKKRIDFYTK